MVDGRMKREDEEDDVVCLDQSFFMNDDYQLTTFTFGSHVIQLLCLQSASTDFDLTGQLVWPGATLLNDFLSNNTEMLQGSSVIELGSGVGVTGILCSKFCHSVLLTDHNEEVLKILNKNIQLQESFKNPMHSVELAAEKLEWGNSDQVIQILRGYSGGFDLILGADISFNNQVFRCFSTQWSSSSEKELEDNASLYWPMSLELRSWIQWYFVKLLDMECKWLKWEELEEKWAIFKELSLRSPSNRSLSYSSVQKDAASAF